ncbi:MAG: hypothetical protein U1F57_09530 [bacterium]
MLKKILSFFSVALCLLPFVQGGCAGNSIFPNIPLSNTSPVLSNPIFLVVDEPNARGYLINSNNQVNFSDASLMVLNLTNPLAPTVIKAVNLQNFSGQGVLNPATKTLYITNRFSGDPTDVTDRILAVNVDESSANFLGIQEFEADSNPFGIAFDGTNLYTANIASLDRYLVGNLNQRTRIDFNVEAVGTSTPVNTQNTRELVLSPSGQFLYIGNRGDKLLILDTQQIPVPDPTQSLTLGGSESIDYVLSDTFSTRGMTSDANYVYVVEGNPASLKILSDKTLPLVSGQPQQILISSLAVAEIPLGNDPNEITLDSVNQRAYVPNSQDNTVSIIDTNLFVEVARIAMDKNLPAGIPVGTYPFSVGVYHSGGIPYLYVLNHDSSNITIMNGATQSIVGHFP